MQPIYDPSHLYANNYLYEKIKELQQQIEKLKNNQEKLEAEINNYEVFSRLSDIEEQIHDLQREINPPKYTCPNCGRSDLNKEDFYAWGTELDEKSNCFKYIRRCKYCINENKK